MSTYRSVDRYPGSDLFSRELITEESELVSWRRPAQVNIEQDEYAHLRKAVPVNKPFFRTLMWSADLPREIQPRALLHRYARVANLIAAAWGDPECFRAYMDGLFTDSRGGRQGFPPDVLRELLALQRYYDTSSWDAVSKRR
jgi:hypothetical protein